jgi:1-phosphofructokinase
VCRDNTGRRAGNEMAAQVVAVALNPSVDRTVEVKNFTPGGLNRAVSSRVDPAGKAINAARVLKSFGPQVAVVGFAGGNTGSLLHESLSKEGIGDALIDISGETRINLKILDQETGSMTEINERGPEIAQADLRRFEAKFRELCGKAKLVVLSGSLPPAVPADYYACLLDEARQFGVRTILDADGEALREGICKVPYAVKPNLAELRRLTGRSLETMQSILDAGRELTTAGISVVIISMGADGAVVMNQHQAFCAKPWKITAASATGAGDSMVGALAGALLRGAELEDIARITVAAGTVTASKQGTQLCTKDEVLESLSFVTLRSLKG